MNRIDEFKELKKELDQTPAELEYTTAKAIARAKQSKRWSLLFKTPVISFLSIIVIFITLVNMFPAVALAMSNVPVLKELVHAVAFDPSLKEAVSHDYYQVVGDSQTQDDVTVTVDYMILDAGHISIFFSVDSPVNAGIYHYDLRDSEGNGLAAAIGFDTMYETDQLEELKIDFIDGGVIPEEFTLTLTINKDENFQAQRSATITVPEDDSAPTVTAEPESTGVDYTFSFKLHPDKQFSKTVNTLSIDQWVEIQEQRIYLEKLEIYPTQARLYLKPDEKNSSFIEDLDVYFEDENGDLYDTKTNGISAIFDSETLEMKALFFESSYFATADHLTLFIDSISLIDKSKRYGFVDYETKSISNLPDYITVDSMDLEGSTLNFTLKVHSDEPNTSRSVIAWSYYDMEENAYSFGEAYTSRLPDDKYTYYNSYKIKDYKDGKYKVLWTYAPKQTFPNPITVELK